MTSLLGWLQGVDGAVIYLAVGLFVFAEDALLLGFVVPGETAAILGGFLASQGRVSLGLMCAVVSAAAVLGDSAGYLVGRRLGPRLAARVEGTKRERRFAGAAAYMDSHGGSAIFLGRFIAFVRTVVPAVAGASGIPYRRFIAYNLPAAILWGTGNVLIGLVAGNSYEKVATALGSGTAVVLAAVLIVALVVWRVRRRRS